MTTLVAWIAIDQRAPSAFYMASDSRISWGSARARWDAGRKLFFCSNHPDIFGYVGDVVFPSLVLGQVIQAADSGLLFHEGDDADQRHSKIVTAIKASFTRRHNVPDGSFEILHASRDSFGSDARFKLWRLSFDPSTQSWRDTPVEVSTRRSALAVALGSGEGSVRMHNFRWEKCPQGGTSRAIFSAFCEAIRSGLDPLSGGVPQLVGMYHTRMPQAFGVVLEGQLHLHGLPLPSEINADRIEWRDQLFQRIDGKTLAVLVGAQRHVRPNLEQ